MVDASPSCVNRRRQNAGMPVIAHEEKTACPIQIQTGDLRIRKP